MHIKTSDQPILHMGYRGYSCNWGLHICGLYETEEERDEIVFGYLNQGDIEGDLQFYCPSERTELDFREKFHRAIAAIAAVTVAITWTTRTIIFLWEQKNFIIQMEHFLPMRWMMGWTPFMKNLRKMAKGIFVQQQRWCGRWTLFLVRNY